MTSAPSIEVSMSSDYERGVRDAADWLLKQYGQSVTTTMPVKMMAALLTPPAAAGGPWGDRTPGNAQ